MGLNEYADLTKEEYRAMMGIEEAKPPSNDNEPADFIDGGNENYQNEFMDAKEFENLSFTSLEEAKMGLARETSMIIKRLGLKNVEELQSVLDTIDQLSDATDNVEQTLLEKKSNIRTAYIDWCKQFNKKIDETRFITFSDNYDKFEKYFKEKNSPIKLNQRFNQSPTANEFADLTKYRAKF